MYINLIQPNIFLMFIKICSTFLTGFSDDVCYEMSGHLYFTYFQRISVRLSSGEYGGRYLGKIPFFSIQEFFRKIHHCDEVVNYQELQQFFFLSAYSANLSKQAMTVLESGEHYSHEICGKFTCGRLLCHCRTDFRHKGSDRRLAVTHSKNHYTDPIWVF